MEDLTTINRIKAAANGDRDARAELWDQYRPFIYQQAKRRKAAASAAGYGYAVEVDDLAQGAYFALVEASKTFDPNRERSFIGWLDYHLRTSFSATLGVRTNRQKRDPIHAAESFEKLLPGYDDIKILDALPDPADPFAEIIEADFQRSIYDMIEDAIRTCIPEATALEMFLYLLQSDFEATILDAYRTAAQITEPAEADRGPAYFLYHKYLPKLRRELMKPGRKALYNEYYFPAAYRSGLGAWRRTGSSSVESAVIKREKMQRRIDLEYSAALRRIARWEGDDDDDQ